MKKIRMTISEDAFFRRMRQGQATVRDKNLLSVNEVAELLRFSPNTVRRMDGDLKPARMGKRGDRMYLKENIFNYLEQKSE